VVSHLLIPLERNDFLRFDRYHAWER
jgi:hypothetical protein